MYRHLILSLVALATTTANATPSDFELWANANAHISLVPRETAQLYIETQPRLGDDWGRVATAQHRVAAVIKVSPAWLFYAGYAWTPFFYDSKYHRDFRDEQRLWQGITFNHKLRRVQWQHRYRQEQRMITRTDGVSHRSRYLLKGSYPWSADEHIGLTWFDEVMFTLNSVSGGPESGYDRNRLFVGPYWRVGQARYEVGYLGEHARRFGSNDRWANVLALNVSYNF